MPGTQTVRPDILYCIEHVARELNIACAVRHFARVKFGLNVHIHVLSHELDPILDQYQPQLIALPFCASRRYVPRAIIERFPHTPILNLACEQLLSHANRRYRMPKDSFARTRVTHAAAGEFFRQWLLESGVASDRIEVVGSMPFQLYRSPYRAYFDHRREALAAAHGLDPDRPWILFPENFSAAFFTASKIRRRVKGGYRAAELREYVAYSRDAFREIAQWCGVAAASCEAELIVRPRPAMSESIFTRAFYEAAECGPLPRLHFVKSGDIQEWILASQAVVSSYSTTLLEGVVADKPVYMLSPRPAPPSARSDWHGLTPQVTNRDAFCELLRDPHQLDPPIALRQWAERNLLSRGDAIENVARLMADLCDGTRPAPVPGRPSVGSQLVKGVRRGVSWPERFLRGKLRRAVPDVFGHECDAIERHLIDERTLQWAGILDEMSTPVAAVA